MNKYYIYIFFVVLLLSGGVYMAKKPRGIRNKNPLNIEYQKSNNWDGQTGVELAGRFATFSEMKFGIRAGAKLVKRYITHYKLVTVFDIINKWAPDHENPTNAYAETVARRMGVDVNQVITTADIQNLIYEMIKFECGVYLSREVVAEGCELAGV